MCARARYGHRHTENKVSFLLAEAYLPANSRPRMYLFLLQLIQIPLIALSRMHIIKQNQMLGNVVFWLGLYAGFPLLCVAYVAH